MSLWSSLSYRFLYLYSVSYCIHLRLMSYFCYGVGHVFRVYGRYYRGLAERQYYTTIASRIFYHCMDR